MPQVKRANLLVVEEATLLPSLHQKRAKNKKAASAAFFMH